MMNKTLTVSVNAKHAQFIQSQIQTARYPSADDAIALALELLEENVYLEDEENKRCYQEWIEETKKKIAIGIEQANRGELTDGKVVLARLREKYLNKISNS